MIDKVQTTTSTGQKVYHDAYDCHITVYYPFKFFALGDPFPPTPSFSIPLSLPPLRLFPPSLPKSHSYSPLTIPLASFSFLLTWLHSGASSLPASSSSSPSSFVLCTVSALCSAGAYTVISSSGVLPMLTNWCCVPAGTITTSVEG